MQSASAELTAALTSKERTLVLRVKADWLRDGSYAYDPGVFVDIFSDTFESAGDIGDLTRWVESLSVDRSLSTDLPDAARVNTGYGAAEATATLAGALAGGTDLARALTAHGGTGGTVRRVNTPITVDIGAVGVNGPEYLRQFTGKIRSVTVDPFNGAVTIAALDGRESMRTPVSLSTAVNVSASTFMTEIATANAATTSFEASLNTSVSTPVVAGSDPWETLQQIAAAEQGIILFDESGTLRFYNRNHLTGGPPVATITVDPAVAFANVKAMASAETIDSVRNYITVTATPLVLDAANTVIWQIAEVLGVPAGGAIVIPVEFPGVVYIISSLGYLAAKNVDGTGGDITNLGVVATAITSSSWLLTVTNPNAFDAFLVRNSTSSPMGDPYLVVLGQTVRQVVDSGYTVVRQDSSSRSAYGAQPLDLSANVWRQSLAAANDLADYLLAALSDPHPTLSGVEIVGDPRLQLADRVRVTEPDGLSLDGDFWLVATNTQFSASNGLTQSVTLRET